MSDSTSRTPSVVEGLPSKLEKGISGLSKQPTESSLFVPSVDRTVVAQSPIAGPSEFYPTGTVASLARVLIGQQLDHFQLHELVGGGGMGAVFRASDTRLDRIVAVKVIPNLGRDLETLRRFRVEAQSAAKLDHPHIARVYYVGETEAWSYIVFEYVEGVNLRDLVIRQGPLSIDDTVCYACQVAEALQHASERSVVHRDIKPSNVLVTSEGIIKVVDMGLARTTALDQSANDLTASGVTLGTFDYISPEQARDPRIADVRSDLYSLGCTMYYMLSGRPPFPEGTAMQKLLMHGSVQADDLRDFRDDISPDLSAIIRKLMAKKPVDRYQVPFDLVADLQCLADLEMLTKSQNAVGVVVAPVTAERSLFEITTPWIMGILAILGSTWYLHSQHLALASFSIPNIAEPAPKSSIRSASVSGISSVRNSISETTSLSAERSFGIENTIEFLPSEFGGTKGVSESPLGSDFFSSSLSESDVDSSASVNLFSGYGLKNQKSNLHGTGRLKSNARILWVRPFEASDPAIDQGLEYRVMIGNLTEALAMADSAPEIEELWLDDEVWFVDQTIEMHREMLAIRSAPERKARIEVRIPRKVMSTLDGNASSDKIVGIDIGSKQLLLDDLDLYMVPPDTGNGSVSLLGLAPGGSVRLMHSTITMAGNGTSWKANGIGLSPEMRSSAVSSTRSVQEPLQIEIEDVVFRGEGDFLTLDTAQRTELRWRNGLLAISGRMFELGGARETSRTPPTIRVDLEQVTIAAQRGFARIRPSAEHPFPVCLTRDSKNCTYAGEGSISLITIENVDFEQTDEGVVPSDALLSWIDLRGRDNAYDNQISTLIKWSSPKGVNSRIGFENASSQYFSERALETSVRWARPHPVQKPFDQQSAGDYLQRDGNFRPGFRPELLPNH